MHLIPTEEEVKALLAETGALRSGHFEYPSGLHSEEYVNVPMAMRSYANARMLGVALSRKVRADTELRAIIPQLSVVAPQSSGIPVAFAVCEALRANQVYWAERESGNGRLRFREGLSETEGEKVLIVDDILRSGRRMTEMKKLVEDVGDQVVGLAVMIYQPGPETPSFHPLPFFYLARINARSWVDRSACDLCKAGVPVERAQV